MDIAEEIGTRCPQHGRQRCWDYDWVLDLDIKSFFDDIDWELLMRPCGDTRIANGCSSTLSVG